MLKLMWERLTKKRRTSCARVEVERVSLVRGIGGVIRGADKEAFQLEAGTKQVSHRIKALIQVLNIGREPRALQVPNDLQAQDKERLDMALQLRLKGTAVVRQTLGVWLGPGVVTHQIKHRLSNLILITRRMNLFSFASFSVLCFWGKETSVNNST